MQPFFFSSEAFLRGDWADQLSPGIARSDWVRGCDDWACCPIDHASYFAMNNLLFIFGVVWGEQGAIVASTLFCPVWKRCLLRCNLCGCCARWALSAQSLNELVCSSFPWASLACLLDLLFLLLSQYDRWWLWHELLPGRFLGWLTFVQA